MSDIDIKFNDESLAEKKEERTIKFLVIDTGLGIKEEDKA